MQTDLLIYGAGALILISLVWQIRTEMRLKKMLLGKDAKNLEDTIIALVEAVEGLNKRQDDIVEMIAHIDGRLKTSIRGVELLRFNPFEDAGSNQSFAIGLLNEKGDGLVLSSLYSRDRMSIFAKPVKSHKSPFDLTSEEDEVIKKAALK